MLCVFTGTDGRAVLFVLYLLIVRLGGSLRDGTAALDYETASPSRDWQDPLLDFFQSVDRHLFRSHFRTETTTDGRPLEELCLCARQRTIRRWWPTSFHSTSSFFSIPSVCPKGDGLCGSQIQSAGRDICTDSRIMGWPEEMRKRCFFPSDD